VTPTAYSEFVHSAGKIDDGGDRRTVERMNESIGTCMTTSNQPILSSKDKTMLDRWMIFRVTKPVKNQSGARLRPEVIAENVPSEVTNRWRAIQMAHMEVRKLIMTGAMQTPNVDMVYILKELLIPTFREHFIDPSGMERDFLRIEYLSTIDCIHRTIYQQFMIRGGLYYAKSITPTRLRSLEPFMVATFQDVVFAFGSFLTQFITSTDRYSLSAMKGMWTKGASRASPFEWAVSRRYLPQGMEGRSGNAILFDPVTGERRIDQLTARMNSRRYERASHCAARESLGSLDSYHLSPANESPQEGQKNEDGEKDGMPEDLSPFFDSVLDSEISPQGYFDFNHIILKSYSHSPTSGFAKILREEIIAFMGEKKIENGNIPEISEVELWIQKYLDKRVVGAMEMVHISTTEDIESTASQPVTPEKMMNDDYDVENTRVPEKMTKRKRRRLVIHEQVVDLDDMDGWGVQKPPPAHESSQGLYSCYMDNVVAGEVEIPDIKCIEIIPRVGLRFSTHWLKYGGSPFEDLCRDLSDIHAHNLKFSSESSPNQPRATKRGYHDLFLGCQDEYRLGKYQTLKPGDPERITKPGCLMQIPKIYCPESSLSRAAKVVYDQSRMSSAASNQCELSVPKQSLDEIVWRTHMKNILLPGTPPHGGTAGSARVLTELDLIMGVSFLVMDSTDNRELASNLIASHKHTIPQDGMTTFVDRVKSKIPEATLFGWFFRTRIPVSVLRVLFPQRYYLFLSMPCFNLVTSSSTVSLVDLTVPSLLCTYPSRLFSDSPMFTEHMKTFLNTSGTPLILCQADKIHEGKKAGAHISWLLKNNLFLESLKTIWRDTYRAEKGRSGPPTRQRKKM